MADAPPDFAALMPFAGRCGIRITRATPGEVRGELTWADDLCTVGATLHGGAIMTLADSVAAACAFLNLPAGASTTTIESKTNFLRGLRAGRALAVATPVHVGRTVIVVQTDVRDEQDRRVALVTQTQAVLGGPARA